MPPENDGSDSLNTRETRVVVLPPTYADGVAVAGLLQSADIPVEVVKGFNDLCDACDEGAGSILLSEEALMLHSQQLLACLARQPVWSELPLIVLSKPGRESSALAGLMPQLPNMSVVERPVRMSTLLSLVRSSMRARMRQYQVRDFLQEREQLLESERVARGEAERAGRMKDEFLATLSHELRTPLNAILGWARLLRETGGRGGDIGEGLAIIERNARSQSRIISDLLDMSRIISGKVHLELQQVDLSAVIEATVETIRPAADARELRLSVSMDDTPCVVQGDPNRLQQVFWNLLSNAVKFTEKGGQVSLTLCRVDSHVEVEVSDTGEGIPAEFLPHLFDRFRQADASSARRHGGLGLGLSIVRQLAELHGGTVSARSDGPGKGSTFRVALPLLAAWSRPVAAVPRSFGRRSGDTQVGVPLSVNLRGFRVLVVDDEPDARALIERLLQDCHAEVMTAASADEALAWLARETPHVLVSDIGLPGTDGYTLLRRIRAQKEAYAGVPAIALTAYVRIEDQAAAIRAGFQSHLPKPVEPAELLQTVARLGRPAVESG